jgi:thiamine biosynthesis lipoprotein ApbE
MPSTKPIRITRAGSLGRADFDGFGTTITVVTTHPSVTARAALVVRGQLTLIDVVDGPLRARAADRLASLAAGVAGGGVLIGVGGDIATAGPVPSRGWRVRIVDGSTEPAATRIGSGGLATVRSAQPGAAWRSVTVAARSCRLARAAATTAASRGQDAIDWIASLGFAARLVGSDGTVCFAGAWPRTRLAA